MTAANWPLVIVESPYAGDIPRNEEFAFKACLDCLKRHEVPFASHLFFPKFLDEMTPEERELGLTAGYAFWPQAEKIVFYADNGWSPGMIRAMNRAIELKKTVETRFLKFGADNELRRRQG